MITNISVPEKWKSQRDNVLKPSSACNVTSMAMGMEITGWDKLITLKPNQQLEDYLMEFFLSREAYDKMKTFGKNLETEGYIPSEIHGVLEWGINKILGTKVVQFKTDWKIKDFVNAIKVGNPVVLSGNFPAVNAAGTPITLGHIVTLVGIDFEDDNVTPKGWIIDDPWGDYRDRYKTRKGDDVYMTNLDFINLLKNQKTDRKWGHIFLIKNPNR